MSKSTGGASQGPGGGLMQTAGQMTVRSTDGVPASHRVAFWRDEVLRWIEPSAIPVDAQPFHARLSRVQGRNAELVELVSGAMTAKRDLRRCRRDGCDVISFEFMVGGTSDITRETGERRIKEGDFSIIDCARPVTMDRSAHRNISLMVNRADVYSRMRSLPAFGSHAFPAHGLTGLFNSHVKATMDQAHALKPDQRAIAIDIATDLALAVLQAEVFGQVAPERFPLGFYHAAKAVIARDCTDCDLTPLIVSQTLGCSRAALYRAFSENDETVAAAIWSGRLDHAERMLNSARHDHLPINEIAYRSGFMDYSTFNRMFKRRFGLVPRDARQHR